VHPLQEFETITRTTLAAKKVTAPFAVVERVAILTPACRTRACLLAQE
jgi:hypothetical protein